MIETTTQEIEISEAVEHQQMLSDISAVLHTQSGFRVFTYLFKHFEYGELPPIGLEGDLLMDKLGSLRPGRALFRIVSEADPRMAGQILANIEKEKITQERQYVTKKV